MSAGFVIRHVVSLAGCVREAASADFPPTPREDERRLAGVLIEIIDGPPAFAARVAAWQLDPHTGRARPDRAVSQMDGIYFFAGLPPGAYRLRVSAPAFGSRLGVVETAVIDVPSPPPRIPTAPVRPVRVDVALPATRLRGVITRADTGASVPGGLVRVRGDPQMTRTDDAGRYELRRLVRGKTTVEVSAPAFAVAQATVTLVAGEGAVLNVQLDPAP